MATNPHNSEQKFDALLRNSVRKTATPQTMNCSGFDPDTASAYLEKSLSTTALTAFEEHLVGCSSCRKHLIELSRLMPTEVLTAENSAKERIVAPGKLAGIREWFSGWKLGTLAGLGIATAAVVLVVVNIRQNRETNVAAVPVPVATAMPAEAVSQPSIIAPGESKARTAAATKSGTTSTTSAETKLSPSAKDAAPPAAAVSSGISPAPPTSPAPKPEIAVDEVKKPLTESKEEASRNYQFSPQARADNWQRNQAPASGPAANQSQVNQMRGAVSNQVEKKEAEARTKTNTEEPNRSVDKPAGAVRNEVDKNKPRIPEKTREKDAAATSPLKAVMAKPARSQRAIGEKTFRLENSVWVDSQYHPDQELPVTRLQYNSEAYEKILRDNSALKPYFELKSVTVVWQGKVYEVRK